MNDSILHKRLIRVLSKRIRLVRVTKPRKVYPYTGLFGPWDQWEIQWDGHCMSSCSRGRAMMRENRKREIDREVNRLMDQVANLRANGFTVDYS